MNKFNAYRVKEININNYVDCPDIKNYKCSICFPCRFYKSSSSFSKHLRTTHSSKWKCKYCHKEYTVKSSHPICKIKQKELVNKFIKSFYNKNDSITFLSKEIKPNLSSFKEEKGPFVYK